MTDNLIQQAQVYTKNQFFGDVKLNVGYAKILARYMKDMGHIVLLDMTDRDLTMKRLTKVVINTEKKLKEEDGVTTFTAQQRIAFMEKMEGSELRENFYLNSEQRRITTSF